MEQFCGLGEVMSGQPTSFVRCRPAAAAADAAGTVGRDGRGPFGGYLTEGFARGGEGDVQGA